VHYCLGANLGRLEATIAVDELAERYPSMALPRQQLPFHPNISFRGPQRMIVEVR
jgi:cytochrome P450